MRIICLVPAGVLVPRYRCPTGLHTTRSVAQISLRVACNFTSALNVFCCGPDGMQAWFSHECRGMQNFYFKACGGFVRYPVPKWLLFLN